MALLAIEYLILKPTEIYFKDEVVLAQAWKKAHQYIRSTNWYADTFELDRSAIDLNEKLGVWIEELKKEDFSFNPLRIVPAPKSERWHFVKTENIEAPTSHRWCPENEETPQPLRPLAHVTIRDQTLLMALMMCLANKVESCQGNTATLFKDVHKQKVVNYGNRLYCHYNDTEASFTWGNSTSYSKYFLDYQQFLARPIHFGGEALQQKLNDQRVYEVHLDIAKFYDCVDRTKLKRKILELCEDSKDPLLNRLLNSFEAWEWDESSSGIYDKVCKKDDESIPKGIPQGLVIGGFLANIYLLEFDQQIQSLIGTELADGVQLLDYCRYVDDMRLIIVTNNTINATDIKNAINATLAERLKILDLEFGDKKTKIEQFRYKRSGISIKLQEIQSKVSGPLSPSEIDEQLGHLEGLIGLAENLRSTPETDQDNTNLLATIETPSKDVRDDTLLRFSANKIHTLLKQKRSLFAQEVDASGNPNPGNWDYLQERMARKFIACWSKDPSLVLLLKKGLELFPDKRIIKPVLEQLREVLDRLDQPIQRKMAQYCLGEIFRHTATTIHIKNIWSIPAHANVDGFFEQLQNVAVEIIAKIGPYNENLIAQARFFCLVRNDSPLEKETKDNSFNIITKMMMGYRTISLEMNTTDFVVNSLLAYQFAKDKTAVIRSVNSILEAQKPRTIHLSGRSPKKITQLVIRKNIFCKKVATEYPDFFYQLINQARSNDLKWPKSVKTVIDKSGIFQPSISGDLCRFDRKSVSLLSVIKRKDNPFSHENAVLALLLAVLNGGLFDGDFESFSDSAVEPEEIIDLSNSKITCSDWSNIQSLNVSIEIKTKDDKKPIYELPDWVEDPHRPLYLMGIFLRSCLIGNSDWSSMRMVNSDQAKYIGLKSSFMKRQLGMMHSPEALNGESAPMSSWVSSLLFHLLQWPGTSVNEANYDWPAIWNVTSLKKLIKNRLIFQKKLFCKMTNIPAYVERINLGWEKDKHSLNVVMVQSLLPQQCDFQDYGVMLDTPTYRARHRRHIASVAELILHKVYSQRSIDDAKYKDSDIDLIIWPELSVNNQDVDILIQLASKTNAIIFTGLTFTKLDGIDGPNNVAKWLIPQKIASGRQFMSRLQGKQNMTKFEAGKIKPWRPYQLFIELVHPAFPREQGFRLTGSICYDATDIKISADLKDKSDAYLVVALNQDVNTFDSMVDALYYHMYQHVTLVNTGEFGGSVAKAPYKEKHEKLISHVHGANQVSISSFEMNMFDFREIGKSLQSGKQVKTKPAG